MERLPESEGPVLGVRVSGKVSLEMENEFIGQCDALIKEHGKINCLVFLDDHPSWGLKAGIEDLKWVMTHLKDINKIAIVSDANFWKWYVALDSPFAKMVGIGEKYFEPSDMASAWAWLKE